MLIPATTTISPTTSSLFASSKNHYLSTGLLPDLFAAYYSARANKRNTYNQVLCERDVSEKLYLLYEDIARFRYEPGRSCCFIVNNPVKREVFAASFVDRIVHHLLYHYLVPVFDPTFIYDSYSCRVGKGTLFAVERLSHHIRSVSRNYTSECWVLKMDIRGYFMSINKEILYGIVREGLVGRGCDRIDPEKFEVMDYLLKKVIFNDPTRAPHRKGSTSDWDGLPASKSLFHSAKGCGLPIGNLTSQLFSNIYLNEFDQFAKRELGCRHYGRYVDDFYVVDDSEDRLLGLIEPMRGFLSERLGLTLHPDKVYLQRQERGVQFVGAYVKDGRLYPSGRFRRLMRLNVSDTFASQKNPFLLRACINSYNGYLSHFSG